MFVRTILNYKQYYNDRDLKSLRMQIIRDIMDIVIFYEFEERELVNACLLKCELERRGYSVEIKKVYEPAVPFLEKPKLIITPFLYHNLDVETFTSYFFPKVDKILNLQYEQVLSRKWLEAGFHCPKEMAKNACHICWSESIKKRLIGAGISEKNLFVTGDLKTDFGNFGFRQFFKSKKDLSKEFKINHENEWILFISSFTLPNAPEYVIDDLSNKLSGDGSEFKKLMVESKRHVMDWVKNFLIKHYDKEFIYRPHPNEARFEDPELIKLSKEYENFHFISKYSVQQWIINSDFINTWISTSIIDAYAMNKQCNILRPVEIDEITDIPIFLNAKHISTYDQFEIDNTTKNENFPIDAEIIHKYYKFSKTPIYESICDLIELMIEDSAYSQDFYLTESTQKSINLFEEFVNTASEDLLQKIKKSQIESNKIQESIGEIIGYDNFDKSDTIEVQMMEIMTNLKINQSKIESQLNEYLAAKENEINTLQIEVHNLKDTVQMNDNEMKILMNSNSWKITKPLRKIVNAFKKR